MHSHKQGTVFLAGDTSCILLLQIFGLHGISLPSLLDHLRKDGEVITIGTETGVLENKRYCTGSYTSVVVSMQLHCKGSASKAFQTMPSIHALSPIGQAAPPSKKRMHPHLKVKLTLR